MQPDRTQYHTPLEMCTQALGIHNDAKPSDFNGLAEVVVLKIAFLKKLVEDYLFSEFAKADSTTREVKRKDAKGVSARNGPNHSAHNGPGYLTRSAHDGADEFHQYGKMNSISYLKERERFLYNAYGSGELRLILTVRREFSSLGWATQNPFSCNHSLTYHPVDFQRMYSSSLNS